MQRFTIDIRDGEVVVDQQLPAGTSIRIELALASEGATAATPERDSNREPEAPRRRAARGSTPPPETHVAADEDDEPDFDERPTFDVEKSQLEAVAKGLLPLMPPSPEPRVSAGATPGLGEGTPKRGRVPMPSDRSTSGMIAQAAEADAAQPQWEPEQIIYEFADGEHLAEVRELVESRSKLALPPEAGEAAEFSPQPVAAAPAPYIAPATADCPRAVDMPGALAATLEHAPDRTAVGRKAGGLGRNRVLLIALLSAAVVAVVASIALVLA